MRTRLGMWHAIPLGSMHMAHEIQTTYCQNKYQGIAESGQIPHLDICMQYAFFNPDPLKIQYSILPWLLPGRSRPIAASSACTVPGIAWPVHAASHARPAPHFAGPSGTWTHCPVKNLGAMPGIPFRQPMCTTFDLPLHALPQTRHPRTCCSRNSRLCFRCAFSSPRGTASRTHAGTGCRSCACSLGSSLCGACKERGSCKVRECRQATAWSLTDHLQPCLQRSSPNYHPSPILCPAHLQFGQFLVFAKIHVMFSLSLLSRMIHRLTVEQSTWWESNFRVEKAFIRTWACLKATH